MSHKFYEVELRFKQPAYTSIPVTAESEEEARNIAMELFADTEELVIAEVREIGLPGKPALTSDDSDELAVVLQPERNTLN
jgi:exosome complex RNA-binding protein Rrp4